jgi:hypothetical protein
MKVNDRDVLSKATLGEALAADWPSSLTLVESEDSTRALVKHFIDESGDTALLGYLNEIADTTAPYRLVRLMAKANPIRVPLFEDMQLNRERLVNLAAAAVAAALERRIATGESTVRDALGDEPDPSEARLAALFDHRIVNAASPARACAGLERIHEVWAREVQAATQAVDTFPERDALLGPPDRSLVLGLTLLDTLRANGTAVEIVEPGVGRWLEYVRDRPSGIGAGGWLRFVELATRTRDELRRQAEQYEPLSDKNADLGAQIRQVIQERDQLRTQTASLKQDVVRLNQNQRVLGGVAAASSVLLFLLVVAALAGHGWGFALVTVVAAVVAAIAYVAYKVQSA